MHAPLAACSNLSAPNAAHLREPPFQFAHVNDELFRHNGSLEHKISAASAWIFESGVLMVSAHVAPWTSSTTRDLHRLQRFVAASQNNTWEDIEEQYVTRGLAAAQSAEECKQGRCVFIDGGAAWGYYSLLSALTAPELLTHAFNPHPTFAHMMLDNLQLNHVARGVCLHEVALSDEAGTSQMAFGTGNTIHPKNFSNAHAARGLATVRTTTLDDLVRARVTPGGQHVRLVKLDVEGHAGAVLRGARRLLASRQVAEWFVGTHGRHEETQVNQLLQEAGYVVRKGPHSLTNPNAFLHAFVPPGGASTTTRRFELSARKSKF